MQVRIHDPPCAPRCARPCGRGALRGGDVTAACRQRDKCVISVGARLASKSPPGGAIDTKRGCPEAPGGGIGRHAPPTPPASSPHTSRGAKAGFFRAAREVRLHKEPTGGARTRSVRTARQHAGCVWVWGERGRRLAEGGPGARLAPPIAAPPPPPWAPTLLLASPPQLTTSSTMRRDLMGAHFQRL